VTHRYPSPAARTKPFLLLFFRLLPFEVFIAAPPARTFVFSRRLSFLFFLYSQFASPIWDTPFLPRTPSFTSPSSAHGRILPIPPPPPKKIPLCELAIPSILPSHFLPSCQRAFSLTKKLSITKETPPFSWVETCQLFTPPIPVLITKHEIAGSLPLQWAVTFQFSGRLLPV